MRKNKAAAMIMAVCMAFTAMPQTAAADELSPVINVKECKSWDLVRSRYITYTINGIECDSREMGTAFNLGAYNLMTENDKKKVAKWMVNAGYDGRVRQFGESGAEVLMDRYNTDTGWKALWDQFKKNIENKYCKNLIPYYGGTNENPTENYEKTLTELLEFDEDTAAYTVLHNNKYYYSTQAKEFIAERDAIEQLLQDGRKSYQILSSSMLSATQAAVKGSSKELISLICDKALVPAITPSSSISSTAKDIFAASLEIADRITGYSGKLQDSVLGKTTEGAAAKSQIDYFTSIANANEELALHCYNQALALHNKMLGEAPDIIAEVDKQESHRLENGRDGELDQYNNEQAAFYDNINARVANLSANTGAYSGIGKDNYDAQVRARDNLSNDIQTWADKKVTQAESILKAAGFCPITSGDERYVTATPDAYIGTYMVDDSSGKHTINNALFLFPQSPAADALTKKSNSAYYSSAFDKYYTEEGIKELEAEKDMLIAFYERLAASIASTSGQYKAYRENYYNEELAFLAKGKGFDTYFETKYCYNYITFHYSTTNNTGRASMASSALSMAASMQNLWMCEDIIDDIEKNYRDFYNTYKAKAEKEQLFKDRTKPLLSAYTKAWSDYGSAASKEQKLLDSGLPNYIYSDTLKLYDSGSGGFNISTATPAQFKAEAKNLAAAYDKFAKYDAERELAEAEFISIYTDVSRISLYSGGMDLYDGQADKVSEISTAYLNVRYHKDYDITSQQAANAENTRKTWLDFDGKSSQNLSLQNSLDTMKNRMASYKRQIKMGFTTQSGYDYLKDYYTQRCDYVDNNTNLGAYYVSEDGKVTDIRQGFDEVFAELKTVLDDPSAYNPVQSLTKEEQPQSDIDASLASGETKALKVSLTPTNATDTRVIWTSSEPSVATVDENGNVTAVSCGTAIIRAEAADGTSSQSQSYSAISYDVYTRDPRYTAEFTILVDGGKTFIYGDVSADNTLAADDAAMVLQKVLVDSYKMPIEEKTDNWLKYADTTADGILAADDATAVMQKVLVDSYVMPCENN